MKRAFHVLVLTLLLFLLTSPILNIKSQPQLSDLGSAEEIGDVRALDPPLSNSAEIRFDPDKYTFIVERGVDLGYRFNATVELYDVTWLFAWQVRVYFNNTLLNATNAYYHPDEPIHEVGHIPLTPVIDNAFNTTHGYVQHCIGAMYPSYVNVTTEDYPLGVGICIIEFEVLTKPPSRETVTSNLTLDNPDTRLRKDPSTVIPCTKKNGLYNLVSANIKVPTDYLTIQEAINAAVLGNTVFVYDGTYYENVIINKTLTLAGQSADTTINGTGGIVAKLDVVSYVVVDGFTIASGSDGLYLFNSQSSTISNCIITKSSSNGISLRYGSSGNTISNNIISKNNGIGIYARTDYLDGSYRSVSNVFLSNNTITENSYGVYALAYYSSCRDWLFQFNNISASGNDGICAQAGFDPVTNFGDCNNWKIYRSEIAENNGNGITGIANVWRTEEGHIDSWAIWQNIITRNGGSGICGSGSIHTFEFMPGNWLTKYGYINSWSVGNNTVLLNSDSGVYVAHYPSSGGWTFSRNSLMLNKYGIRILYGNHVLRENSMNDNAYNFGVSGSFIEDIDVSNTINGKPMYYLTNRNGGQIPVDAGYVALVDSANITVGDFNFSHNEQGIMLYQTANITLENICASDSMYGICAQESSNFTIRSNRAVNNTYGVYLQDSANGTIMDNWEVNNTNGIYFRNSFNCTVAGNSMEENSYGIYLSESSNNSIFPNNFLRNSKKQAAMDGTTVNIWNDGYPLGGNYWSNHTGPDWCKGTHQNETGSDGIVDLPYVIGTNNRDDYPLSAPWSSPVRIITPGNNTYRELSHNKSDTNLSFTLDFSPDWIGYSLDDQTNVTVSGNTTLLELPYGWHRIILYANDTSGNMWTSIRVHFAVTFLTDINYDRTVDIDDLVETTWRYGSVPGDSRWNVYADVNRDGIIDIDDVTLVINDYGKIW